jgi:hypothetical protein
MDRIPKVVLQRLQASQKAEAHPDPDLLAAFLEQSLGERERGVVMEHLARCVECREVAAVAQPQLELAHIVAATPATPARSRWFSAPTLRWAAGVSCVLVVGAVVTLSRRELKKSSAKPQDARSAEFAYYSLKPPEIATSESVKKMKETSSRQPSPTAAAQLKSEIAALDASNGVLKERAQAVEMQKRILAAPLSAGPRGHATAGLTGGALGARPRIARAAPPPPASKMESQRAMEAYQQQNQIQVQNPQAAISEEASQNAAESVAKDEVTVAIARAPRSQSETVTVESKPMEANNAPQAPQTLPSRTSNVRKDMAQVSANFIAPRWTLSSDGATVLRSFDSGKTWEMTPLGDRTRKTVFRAVAFMGPEVWVGGTAGALYHSSDVGQHWAQVKPVLSGKGLDADIIRIDFTDPEHLRLTTSTGEIWYTDDGARTWKRLLRGTD